MATSTTRIYIDELDRQLIDAINAEGRIALRELPRKHPEFEGIPITTLWYRVRSIARERLIRVEKMRNALVCYALAG
jgi:DNA-binding Lrp family transcriptional regulator